MGRPSVLASTLTIGVAILATMGIAVASAPTDAHSIAAIFPPWWTRAQAFEAASRAGDVVRLGRFPGSVIVHDDKDGLSLRLRAAGALALVGSSTFLGCAGPSSVSP